jgi:DNA-binding transcriptional LysR family regulator
VIANVLAADLTTRVRHGAPGVSLRLLGESHTTSTDLCEGRALISRLDPATTVTLTEFAALDHAVVSRRGRLRGPVDDVLDTYGLSRRIVLSAPTLDVALRAVATGDLVTVAPAACVSRLAQHPGISAHSLPFTLPRCARSCPGMRASTRTLATAGCAN